MVARQALAALRLNLSAWLLGAKCYTLVGAGSIQQWTASRCRASASSTGWTGRGSAWGSRRKLKPPGAERAVRGFSANLSKPFVRSKPLALPVHVLSYCGHCCRPRLLLSSHNGSCPEIDSGFWSAVRSALVRHARPLCHIHINLSIKDIECRYLPYAWTIWGLRHRLNSPSSRIQSSKRQLPDFGSTFG